MLRLQHHPEPNCPIRYEDDDVVSAGSNIMVAQQNVQQERLQEIPEGNPHEIPQDVPKDTRTTIEITSESLPEPSAKKPKRKGKKKIPPAKTEIEAEEAYSAQDLALKLELVADSVEKNTEILKTLRQMIKTKEKRMEEREKRTHELHMQILQGITELIRLKIEELHLKKAQQPPPFRGKD